MPPLYSQTSIEDALYMYYLIPIEMRDRFRGFTHRPLFGLIQSCLWSNLSYF